MAIDGLKPIDILWPEQGLKPAARPSDGPSGDFAGSLRDALSEVRNAEGVAEKMATGFAQGDPTVGIHEVMIAAEKASLQLRYAVTLKNKLIDAYRELMNSSG